VTINVIRWVFHDPTGADPDYTVPINPNVMSSIYPKKTMTMETTTAVNGKVLLWQGMTKPVEWSFGGEILDETHFENLRHWVYDKNYRIQITDHFGRVLKVVLESFEPTPKRAINVYWRHQYTVTGILISAGPPTVLS